MERFGPTRRGGPVFRWLGEPLAIDLANTIMVLPGGEAVDLLASPEDLRLWLAAEHERLGDCTVSAEHLDEVLRLRDAVHSLLTAAAERAPLPMEALDLVNSASAAAPIAPQLATRGGEPRLVERGSDGDPLAIPLGILARSTITLLAGPERERLRICRAPSCGMFFLGARRWCCAACGNRARAARHYSRTKLRAQAGQESD